MCGGLRAKEVNQNSRTNREIHSLPESRLAALKSDIRAECQQRSAPTAPDVPAPSVAAADVRSVFLRVSPRKATGADGVTGHALRSCADQLVDVFTIIFNLSLLQAEVPTCFMKTIINPVPKKA
eukprot:g39827.t1